MIDQDRIRERIECTWFHVFLWAIVFIAVMCGLALLLISFGF
jgi:hypothetical protein